MTHTVHPYAHRLGVLRDWKSRWFTPDRRRYREYLKTDTVVREYLVERLRGMYVADIEIERNAKMLRIIIKTSRPGVIIGRSGEGATALKRDVTKILERLKLSERPELKIDIEEVRSPESNAAIVAAMVAEGLEKRFPFRRVLKQTVEKVMANRDVLGVKVYLGGRLGGAEMSRSEAIKRGRIPLQTLRADIDFAKAEARLKPAPIGIKVWIYKGDIFDKEK